MLHIVYFSPSGTTKTTVNLIADALGMEKRDYDVTAKVHELVVESGEDTVLFAAPVYAGRIPLLAAERFASVKGKGQKAVVVVVYGNRDYDDALLELCDLVTEQGFEVIAAGAFIGEHCIFPRVATGRPDAEDQKKIQVFAGLVKEAMQSARKLDLNKVKGNRPYKKVSGVPLHPKAEKKWCDHCGICAVECPTGAINKENPLQTDNSRCITCCRCVHVCPNNARRIGGMLYKIAGLKFVKDNTRRLEAEWFI